MVERSCAVNRNLLQYDMGLGVFGEFHNSNMHRCINMKPGFRR